LRRWSRRTRFALRAKRWLTRKLQSTPTGMLLMGTAAAFGAHFNRETVRWVNIVTDSGIKMLQQ
jgi:hypothetical protein